MVFQLPFGRVIVTGFCTEFHGLSLENVSSQSIENWDRYSQNTEKVILYAPPVTICERTFSKMKLIKIITRNTISDTQLNDLCVLTVKRDFNINFEQLMNDFADSRKNSRIILK
jgi:hypothetical protein